MYTSQPEHAAAGLQVEFDLGEPFQPFNQLMGVFPAASKHALPELLQPLFDSDTSPILDFYPKDFKVDMNGKRFAWQGVALLPFIEEERLLAATEPIFEQLPPEDKRRNERCVPPCCFVSAQALVGGALSKQLQASREV